MRATIAPSARLIIRIDAWLSALNKLDSPCRDVAVVLALCHEHTKKPMQSNASKVKYYNTQSGKAVVHLISSITNPAVTSNNPTLMSSL